MRFSLPSLTLKQFTGFFNNLSLDKHHPINMKLKVKNEIRN